MKIVGEIKNEIPVGSMEDGDIATITKWVGASHYVGDIIQRYGYHLIPVGKPSDQGWGSLFSCNSSFLHNGECMVRVLPKGTTLEIE